MSCLWTNHLNLITQLCWWQFFRSFVKRSHQVGLTGQGAIGTSFLFRFFRFDERVPCVPRQLVADTGTGRIAIGSSESCRTRTKPGVNE